MTTPLRARKSPLPRIDALPMLANARHCCQPVGRPLLDPDGRSAQGPDPLGLTPPQGWVPNAVQVEGQPAPEEWTCSICLSRLDGPAEEEEETTISFEATVDRDYVEFMALASNNSLYEGSAYTMLGYDPAIQGGEDDPIQSITRTVGYGGHGKTWARIEIKVDRDGRKIMEEIRALASSQALTNAFFGYSAVVDTTSIIDSHEERYVVQQLEVCGHQFHRACLKRMFSGSFNVAECPECKQYIVAQEVQYLRSEFNLHEVVGPMLQREVDRYNRLISGPNGILSDPNVTAGDPDYVQLPAQLAAELATAQAALAGLAQQTTLARQKKPGELDANNQPIATWPQMSNFVNPQGNSFPPRQKFPLPPDQERRVIRYIHTLFEAAVEAVAALFPVRADGDYPDDIRTSAFYMEIVHLTPHILSDDAFLVSVRDHVQTRYTDASTPLTPGNERIFLNTWNSLKTKATKTGTALRLQPFSQQRVFTIQMLDGEYKRMLATANLDLTQRDASLGVQRVRPQTLAAFDRIARAGQYKVLGTRLFHNVEHLHDEISRIRLMHDALVVQFSALMARPKSYRLIDIALRTHPLLDCGTNLLNQTVRLLHARNHEDFRRQYKYNKYFIDSGIWDVVLQIEAAAPNLCTHYSKQSILDTLLVHAQGSPDAMERSVNGWLELIRPDVVEIYRLAPWRIHWTTDDLFNAVTAAYMLLPFLSNNNTTDTLVLMLKSMLAETIRSETELALDSRVSPQYPSTSRPQAMDTGA